MNYQRDFRKFSDFVSEHDDDDDLTADLFDFVRNDSEDFDDINEFQEK